MMISGIKAKISGYHHRYVDHLLGGSKTIITGEFFKSGENIQIHANGKGILSYVEPLVEPLMESLMESRIEPNKTDQNI